MSNLETDALSKHLLHHRRRHGGSLIENQLQVVMLVGSVMLCTMGEWVKGITSTTTIQMQAHKVIYKLS